MADCQMGLFGSFILSTVCCIGAGEMCSIPLNGRSNSRIISTPPETATAHKTKVKADIKLRGANKPKLG